MTNYFRTNAVRVLQKFMEEQIIQDVQDPTSRRFKDDTTLYRYNFVSVFEVSHLTFLVLEHAQDVDMLF